MKETMKDDAKNIMTETRKNKNRKGSKIKKEINRWFYNRINRLFAFNNYSIQDFSQITGLSQSTVRNLIYRESVPNLETIWMICSGFGISFSDFFFFFPLSEIRVVTEEEYLVVIEYRRTKPDDRKHLKTYWAGLNRKQPEEFMQQPAKK